MVTANVPKFRYEYKVHPLCALFPDLPPDEFKKLKDDIQAHGQQEPIMLSADGEVLLDGRHRLRACKELGIQPRVERFLQPIMRKVNEGLGFTAKPPITDADYIWSKNILRRHLTADQRVAIAHRWSDAEKAAAKERQREHGHTAPGRSKENTSGESAQSVRSRTAIAQKAHVSEHKVRQVESVAKSKPELLPKIESGEMTLKDVTKATRVRKKPKSIADTVAATIKNHPERVVDVDSQPATSARGDYLSPQEVADDLIKRSRKAVNDFRKYSVDPREYAAFNALMADKLELLAKELRSAESKGAPVAAS